VALILGQREPMQNTSHAVMAQRIEPNDSPDDFPTPPWATRALVRHILSDAEPLANLTCLEPACGAGHMAKVLEEYFRKVQASDAYYYGYGHVRDFLTEPYGSHSFDWVITNPPFRLAEDFVLRAHKVARHGVAILARTVFLEIIRPQSSLNSPNVYQWSGDALMRRPLLRQAMLGSFGKSTHDTCRA
jgi:hypothetical protein